MTTRSFMLWQAGQRRLALRLMEAALFETASRHDVLLAVKLVNPSALPHFLRPDVQSKGPGIDARTLRSGLRSNGDSIRQTRLEHSKGLAKAMRGGTQDRSGPH